MKITKFWVKGYRSYKDYYEVPISDATINLVTADNNGAGKTSLFFAFYYLIIGYVQGSTIDEYINWDSNEMSCGVEFLHLNKKFSIETSVERGKTAKKTLVIDGEEFAGSSNVNKKLKEYFDPSLFLNSTAIFQDSKTFTTIKDSERRDNLKKVFNLDYSSPLKDLDAKQKDVEEKIKKSEQDLAILKSKTFEIQNIQDFKDVTEENVESKQKELASLKNKSILLGTDLATLDSNNSTIENLNKDIKNSEASLSNKRTTLSTVVSDLKKLESYEKNTNTLDSLKQELTQVSTVRMASYDDTLLETAKSNLSSLKTKVAIAIKNRELAEKGLCPTCGKEFTAQDLDKHTEEISCLNVEIEKANSVLTEQLANKKIYDDKFEANRKNIEKKSILNEKIDAEDKRLTVEQLNNDKSLIAKQAEKTNLDNDIIALEKDISDKKLKLSSMSIKDSTLIKQELATVNSLMTSLDESIQEYIKIHTENALIIKNNEKLNKEEIQTKADIEKEQAVYDTLAKDKEQISKMKAFLKNEFPSYVISAMIEQIQDSMNEFIEKIYYKSLDVDIRATDDNISVSYGTGSHKVDTVNASGAEKAILSLSYCNALNELQHYNILFVDEVDQSLTEDASLKLADAMVTASDMYDSLFAVSHVKATKDFYAMKGANVINVDER